MGTAQDRQTMEPILLKIDPEVTGLTRLGRTTVYAEIAAGRLRAVKVGRSVRIRRDDLEAWIEARTTETAQAVN
jgi:excisionase family DNA binding protein